MTTKTNGNGAHAPVAIESPSLPAISSNPPEIDLSTALLSFALRAKTMTSNPDELASALDAFKAIFRVPAAMRQLVADALTTAVPLIERVGDENAQLYNQAARLSVGVKTTNKRVEVEGVED